MNIFLTQSAEIGNAKGFLLRKVVATTAQAQQHQIVENPEQAQLIIAFGASQPQNAAFVGKKIFVANPEQALNAPETCVQNALAQAVDYVATAAPAAKTTGVKNIVAVTACPTGVAHTFMSAEAIENYAKKQGWQVKVETRGQVGAGNVLSAEEIAAADLVFVAADIDVPLDKFKGKLMYRTSTGLALKKTAQEFDKAFAEAKVYEGEAQSAQSAEKADEKKGIYKHLMTGVSHMLPFVVAGGLLIAISFLFGENAFKDANLFYGIPTFLMDIGGGIAFKLMIAMFAGYVAFSIADRPGLAPGVIAGVLTSNAGAGILGGIIAGFLAGYIVLFLNKAIKLPRSFASLKPILILPLLGTLIASALMVYIVNPPVAVIMSTVSEWLQSLSGVNSILLGIILGCMMCFDMGGPVNKAAYLFGTGLLASGVNTPMAAVMAAGMVPPIGMAIATWIARKKFSTELRETGNASFVLGLCFISEGALPFVASDPLRVIISSMLGGATAGALSMLFAVELRAPHGGVIVLPFVSQPLMYLGAIALGSLVTGVVYAAIKPKLKAE